MCQVLLETPRFRVVRRQQRLADGQLRPREVVEHSGSVVILPMIDANHVCLIENFRIAVGRTLIELPAGTLEAGEDPAECAQRELIEETGYRAGRIVPLCEFLVSPGILSERMYAFLATDLTAGPMALEAGEQIVTRLAAWPDALAMAADGRIEDAKTLVSLLTYDRCRNA